MTTVTTTDKDNIYRLALEAAGMLERQHGVGTAAVAERLRAWCAGVRSQVPPPGFHLLVDWEVVPSGVAWRCTFERAAQVGTMPCQEVAIYRYAQSGACAGCARHHGIVWPHAATFNVEEIKRAFERSQDVVDQPREVMWTAFLCALSDKRPPAAIVPPPGGEYPNR